jgi:CubicO group peptidase (beta-lactamase class C family)
LVEVARGAAAERVDSAALARLLEAASAAHSDAVVVLYDGEVVGEWYRGGESKRIEAMSVTKSIVNLAFGRLVTLGAIRSIDLPVSTFYPEWREGERSRITIRLLLSHTSGLRSHPTPGLCASSDFVRFALGADVTSEPGTRFTYNNTAVNLLAGIFASATGKRMDLFLRDDLFAKLGITDFNWELDSAGNPHAMSGLQIHAADLAKLGQLALDRGRWQGEQLIAESWFDESLRAAIELEPLSGLLWWLIPDGEMSLVIDAENIRALRDVGVDDAFLAQAERLQGRYGSGYELLAAYASVFGDDWRPTIMEALGPHGNLLFRREIGEIIGYNANGYLGQYIVVYPAERLVAVRMVTNSAAYDEATDGFIEIEKLVRALRR